MNERTLQVLEFHKVISQLTNYIATNVGKELINELEPSVDIEEVRLRQDETDEASHILRLDKDIPLGGITDIRPSVKRSRLGGILSIEECLNISTTIYGGARTKDFLDSLEEELPILKDLASKLNPLTFLEKEIKNCIDDEAFVIDHASSKLRSIRSSIRTYEGRVRERLEHFTRTKSNHLSDAIITIRNDRYVLPVKHEHRSSIGGIVHDQSSSGQTLFMEPKAVVELNNQLQEAFLKEEQEIERILRMLSELVAKHEEYLLENISVLARIDFMMAKAKLARQMKAVKPNVNNEGRIKMKQARHPLIPLDQVVANDVEIGDAYRSMLITGPNTGGKTVVLKLIGLCTLMAQAGLRIPAFDGCELAVFNRVYADIGDEQSIEQNLSTFSSHMKNIVHILKEVDENTLVLFDELGSGTDPQEGASLAMAILDDVILRGACVVATTHYPELKAYGYNREKVINASVEFNVETLQPTYRLLIGVPGRSNAFEISQRLGLSQEIINHAKEHTGVESTNVKNMIASLEASRANAEKEYEFAHQFLNKSEELQRDLQKEWKMFQEKREELYIKAEEKADHAIEKARAKAASIVADIRNIKGKSFKEHEWIDAQKQLEEASPKLSTTPEQAEQEDRDIEQFKVGDDVKVKTINQRGTIIDEVSENEYIVQVGMMKVNVKRTNLQGIQEHKKEPEKQVTMIKRATTHTSAELDLRGERYEEALRKLDKYMDDAILAGLTRAEIIHGKGTGALRKGVTEFVKNHPQIRSYRPGNESEGGSGVTVIEFS